MVFLHLTFISKQIFCFLIGLESPIQFIIFRPFIFLEGIAGSFVIFVPVLFFYLNKAQYQRNTIKINEFRLGTDRHYSDYVVCY